MGADLSKVSEAARSLFESADLSTDLPLTSVCFDGPPERLTDTSFAQPGVVAVSLAAAVALRERLSQNGLQAVPAMCAGHSVGEYAALAFSGALTVGDALRVVGARGRAMAEASAAVDGSMVAVLGLDEAALSAACEQASSETGFTAQVANLNAPGQIVISGHRRALDRACELARAAGAKRAIPLEVSGPFHSVYMQPAADLFRTQVEAASVSTPSLPIVLNVTAQLSADPAELRREMIIQVTSPVRWSQTVETMWANGCTVFVELGPGQVLSGLIKRTVKDATVLNVEDEASLSKTAEKLAELL